MQCGQGCVYLFSRQLHADLACRRGKNRVPVAGEDFAGTCATLVRGRDAGLTRSTVRIPGIDQCDAKAMLTPFEVTLSDDQRRCDDFVAGKHRGSRGRLVGDRTGKVRLAAGFQTCAHRGKREAAWHLIVANKGSGGHISHVAFTLSG
jgi:hypothetical protein